MVLFGRGIQVAPITEKFNTHYVHTWGICKSSLGNLQTSVPKYLRSLLSLDCILVCRAFHLIAPFPFRISDSSFRSSSTTLIVLNDKDDGNAVYKH